ncbi:MAG TPA: hypothetical protein VHW00_13115 [Thermoanaerobaculia bacterium]|nr:hypothetical protein [Thermoanaerobaculia bacterium]
MLPEDTRDRIVRIFTLKRAYTTLEAASILKIDLERLNAEIEARDIEAVAGGGGLLPWREVAYLALRRWPLRTIFDALGPEGSSHLPDLLRPTKITATLPSYQVRMLEVLAREQQLDVSTFLQLYLLDLASAESPFLGDQIPGFRAAFQFPFGEEL